jgi:hypothetical protein
MSSCDREHMNNAQHLDETGDRPAFVCPCLIRGEESWTDHRLDIVVGNQLATRPNDTD